jgi:hypothetical protein
MKTSRLEIKSEDHGMLTAFPQGGDVACPEDQLFDVLGTLALMKDFRTLCCRGGIHITDGYPSVQVLERPLAPTLELNFHSGVGYDYKTGRVVYISLFSPITGEREWVGDIFLGTCQTYMEYAGRIDNGIATFVAD